MSNIKVLITGATGFVGRNTLPVLIAENFEVHAITRTPTGDLQKELSQKDVRWHAADLFDFTQTGKLIEEIRPTHLLHLAWEIEHGRHWMAKENFDWVAATNSLYVQFAENGGQRLVTAGTCFEYSLNESLYREHETPIDPGTIYGKCKAACRILSDAIGQKYNIDAAWARLFFTYGKYDNSSRLIPYVVNSLLGNRDALCSHGNQIRDFLYVDDAAAAFAKLLKSDVRGEVNIASGEPVTLKEIIYKIGKITGKPDLIKLGKVAASPTEPPQIVADIERLRREVGWSPKWSLENGLRETVEWWRTRI